MTWNIDTLPGQPGSKERAEAYRRQPGTAWWEPMAVRPDTVAHPCVLRARKRTTRGKNRTAFYVLCEPTKPTVVEAIASTVRLSAKDMRTALASIAGLPCSDQAGTAYQAVTIARRVLGHREMGTEMGRTRPQNVSR